LADVLGGEWRPHDAGRCFVVERRLAPSAPHGQTTVGRVARDLEESADQTPLVGGAAAARPPVGFFDLETTGLSGGAGTYAFLVGCAWFDGDGSFVVRQFVLARPSDERPLLEAVADEFARAGALVSFNGRTFDAPLLESRCQYHRMPWAGAALPHLDVLHPARRFWRETGPGALAEAGCSLAALERQVIGAHRRGDVPGLEIPSRYFTFLRSGDARPLAPVLEHNRLDLLSLAALTARLLVLLRRGPAAARHAREALALGGAYARAGLDAPAREALARAAGLDGPPLAGVSAVRVDALRALALSWRRARRFDEAAACWRRLIDGGCPPRVAREAIEALAIHHEHRVRDLAAARTLALRSLEMDSGPGWKDAVRRRVDRLDRKLTGAAGRAALDLDM
jgi:uncharacterized protein YprB with RNaseH-like and TPR domain